MVTNTTNQTYKEQFLFRLIKTCKMSTFLSINCKGKMEPQIQQKFVSTKYFTVAIKRDLAVAIDASISNLSNLLLLSHIPFAAITI